MKRAFVYLSHKKQNGKVLVVEDTLEAFKLEISNVFEIGGDFRLFTENGCEIVDVRVIRDDEKLYVNCGDSKSCDTIESSLAKLSLNRCSEVSDWITLNVGGRYFTTSRSTLQSKEPLSMLARMFADDNNMYLMNPSATDSRGAYLIDRSPEYFEPILNYLRHGEVIIDKYVNPRGVLEEAVFYGIDSMIPHIQKIIEDSKSYDSNHALTRMDVVRALIKTSTSIELRFQGVNLAGADLNRLDLRFINFKYAFLSRCNLSGANLSYCCLERADLSHANLEGAQLLGVKALCANMEGANLEGSNMSGVNLRVATLKNANLQNCDLRTAVLAGADLECCDLSGSDLHEANLRGANLKDAAFELMLTPLHMSQTVR
ncbi:BTB/POZ domain-containing protein KCTD9 isoform X2 [Bombyx mandarina]|uniref:BTB/POZ domain-containing protein KCTD9 n=2 Tax=Bombyx TaxID=7090 RepID=A0A8R2AHU6_BOMMO|nr:BTB/POZ domain-containing protein KCTD9 isoform X2 [Bombyx mori]XP_028031834.1 BTB/POZ domain-containing protein KCTD9 isoform X2 [Bombyx mandarina]